MKAMVPDYEDEASVLQSAIGLERQVHGMKAHLDQFQPTVGLSGDGRLMYMLAENPNGQTNEFYPNGYARPLLDDEADVPHRLSRIRGVVREMEAKMAPFVVADVLTGEARQSRSGSLTGSNLPSVQAHATPLGFMAAQGCDVTWNGRTWETMPGLLELSKEWPDQEDMIIPRTELPPRTGLVYLAVKVRYGDWDDGLLNHDVKYLGAEVRMAEAGEHALARTDMAYDADNQTWSPGIVIAPLAWVSLPEDGQAPGGWPLNGYGDCPAGHRWIFPSYHNVKISPLDP